MNKIWVYQVVVVLSAISLVACASATPVTSANPSSNSSSDGSPTSSAVDTSNIVKINLNTSSADDFLAAIPGLGNRMVREFEEYRPYISIQQFRQEIGKYVDESQVAEYEKYVYVPIAFNESDAETVQQIPGLETSEAEALMAGRPYATVEDFLSALSQYITAEDLEIARTYLGQ